MSLLVSEGNIPMWPVCRRHPFPSCPALARARAIVAYEKTGGGDATRTVGGPTPWTRTWQLHSAPWLSFLCV